MTPDEIKSRMKEKGFTERTLAKRLRASKSSIHFLIHRKFKSDRLEKLMARALGVKFEKLRGENGEAA